MEDLNKNGNKCSEEDVVVVGVGVGVGGSSCGGSGGDGCSVDVILATPGRSVYS